MTSVVDMLKHSRTLYGVLDMGPYEKLYFNPNSSAVESNMTMVENHLLDKNSSIVITCADTEIIRTLMLAAKRIGMLETGQFVFYNVDLFGAEDVENYQPWHSSNVRIKYPQSFVN